MDLGEHVNSLGIVRVGFAIEGTDIPEPTSADMTYVFQYMRRFQDVFQKKSGVAIADIMVIKNDPVFNQLPEPVRDRYDFVPLPYKAVKLEDVDISEFLARQLHVDGLMGLDFTLHHDPARTQLVLDVVIVIDRALMTRQYYVDIPQANVLDRSSLMRMFSVGFDGILTQLED